MYHFALCDDDPRELDRMEALLNAYAWVYPGREFNVQRFSSAASLLVEAELQSRFDLVFLDVYLPDASGIETARELRRLGISCPILFVTLSREHALEAFGVGAVQYLIKPVLEPDFFAAMDLAFERLSHETRGHLTLKTEHTLRRVAARDIVSCETRGNYQCLRLADGEMLRTRMTSAELFGLLGPFSDFVRCGASFIVNLNHVARLDTREVHLSDGGAIPIPRGLYPALRERYFGFYGGK